MENNLKLFVFKEGESFGLDFFLVQKVINAGYEAGANQKFWEKLSQDKELFRKIVALVESPEVPRDFDRRRWFHALDNLGEIEIACRQVLLTRGKVTGVSVGRVLHISPQAVGQQILKFSKELHVMIALEPRNWTGISKIITAKKALGRKIKKQGV